jgi:hypothetical protein
MAAKPDKPLFVRLPPDLRLDLAAFCEAHFKAPAVQVIQEALRHFIASEIEASDPAFREKYLEARNRLSGRPAEAIRLVPKKPG